MYSVIYVIAGITMLIASFVLIVIPDFKKLSITTWKILLFILLCFIAHYIILVATGVFTPWSLWSFFIFVILETFNELCNKNLIFGQSDADLMAAAISLILPSIFYSGLLSAFTMVVWYYIILMIMFLIFFAAGIIRSRIFLKEKKKLLRETKIPIAGAFAVALIFVCLFAA